MTAVPAQAELESPAHVDVNVVYTLSKQDFSKAVTYARAAGQAFAPLNVTLTADTFPSVLDLADKMHLNCLTQKCEDTLTNDGFELTTGSSATDCHSVLRWAHIAQKYHLVALQMRCEHFMCNNFHRILDDPLLQDLNRQSLLRMLRAQSAMVSMYQQNLPCPETWGLASAGPHGARPAGNHCTDPGSSMSDNYSALDTSQYGDSTATSDLFTKTSDVLHDSCDMDSTAESHEVTSKRRPVKLSNISRSWSHPDLPLMQ